MNILILSQVFPPKRGGVQTLTYNTAKYLANLGHNVIVVTSKWGTERRNFHKMDNFIVYRFKSFNPPELKFIPQISSFRFMPSAFFKLPKIIKKHKIQIIHAHGRFFSLSFFSVIMNKLIFKRPMIISVVGRLKFGVTGIIEDIFDKVFTKNLYQNSGKIICVNKPLKERLINFKIASSKIEIIPTGVDIHVFKKVENINFFDELLQDKKDYKKVIFIGRLDKQKGVEFLLKAIPNVIEEYERVHFFILGSDMKGNEEKELKLLVKKLNIEDHLNFVKFESKIKDNEENELEKHFEKIVSFYSSADIFCLPSIHEGFPLTIVEALSIGLIIVASATGGIPEVIIEEKNGYLFKPKDVNQLAQKLIMALKSNTEKIKEIQNNNIELARNKYSWEKIVKKIEDQYQKILKL